jgi:CheY-like chemotaxis protein
MKKYFDRFKTLKYQKDGKLPIDIPLRILWIDEDVIKGHALGNSMRKSLGAMGVVPKNVSITYSDQESALDELLGSPYSMIILDHDSYKGVSQGISTLKEIRNVDGDIPIIYTTGMPSELKNDFVKENVEEIMATHQIPTRLPDLIDKYMKGDGD